MGIESGRFEILLFRSSVQCVVCTESIFEKVRYHQIQNPDPKKKIVIPLLIFLTPTTVKWCPLGIVNFVCPKITIDESISSTPAQAAKRKRQTDRKEKCPSFQVSQSPSTKSSLFLPLDQSFHNALVLVGPVMVIPYQTMRGYLFLLPSQLEHINQSRELQ